MQDATLIDEFNIINDPRHDKIFLCKMRNKALISCRVTAQLISAFVFAT